MKKITTEFVRSILWPLALVLHRRVRTYCGTSVSFGQSGTVLLVQEPSLWRLSCPGTHESLKRRAQVLRGFFHTKYDADPLKCLIRAVFERWACFAGDTKNYRETRGSI